MSKDYTTIFKAYDIRSLYNEPMDTTCSYSLWYVLWKYLIEKRWADQPLLVASDWREWNEDLLMSFLAWFYDAWGKNWHTSNTLVQSLWAQKHDFWVCSTAFFYWCVYQQYELWVIFTASHNPPWRVWMKIVDKSAALLPTELLQWLIDEYIPCPYDKKHMFMQDLRKKIYTALDKPHEKIMKKRITYVSLVSNMLPEKNYKLVVDYSWGTATGYEYAFFQLLQQQGWEIIHLNEKTDRYFSAHLSDTNQPINYQQLAQAVQEHHADCGIMFDGDGDRLWVVDQYGNMIQWDMLIPIIAQSILAQQPWSPIIYDITCSNNVLTAIKKAWWTATYSKVWYKNVKQEMLEHGAVFGGELSGHLLFPETWYAESPLLALCHFLQTLDQFPDCAAMVQRYTHWHKLPVMNYAVDDKASLLHTIQITYQDYTQNLLDWVRVDAEEWWFLIRPSNTEPKVRLYIEATTQEQCAFLLQELEAIIGSSSIG